jgi:hypothetical protein
MSYNRAAWYDQNYSAPNTGYNFGPYGITATVAKLLEVSASIFFGTAGENAVPSGQLQNPIIWGVQWGPAGFTPLVLPADIGAAGYLWSQLPKSTTWGNAVWAPTTGDGVIQAFGADNGTWRGQKFIGNPIDFYVSYGAIVGGFPNVFASLSLEATYAY